MIENLQAFETQMLLALIIPSMLVVYHHVLYPVLLRLINKRLKKRELKFRSRNYMRQSWDHRLPRVAIIIPAFNEEKYIAEKLRNMATLDYPSDRLVVHVFDDGSTDNTLSVARRTVLEPELGELHVEIHDSAKNRGKVALVNHAITLVDGDVVVLTDASAILSHDALLRMASHFRHKRVGVVAATYSLFNPGSQGEEAYWRYQTTIKQTESDMGSVIGVHGAMYAIRKNLLKPLPADTINDDFIIPMNVVAAGYRCVYDTAMIAVELEKSNASMDASRRVRIAMGNVQQAVRLLHLCHPRHGMVAFNFLSGKVLRVLMPICLLVALLATVGMTLIDWRFALLLALELSTFAIYVIQQYFPSPHPSRIVAFIHYFYAGHLASARGLLRYFTQRQHGPWKRVA